MKTIRQQILDAVETKLKTVLIASNFSTDIGNNVFKWRVTKPNPDEMPACLVWDPSEEIQPIQSSEWLRKLTVEVYVFMAGDGVDEALRDAMGDVERLFGENKKWGGLARNTLPTGSEMTLDHKDVLEGATKQTFNIEYLTGPFEP